MSPCPTAWLFLSTPSARRATLLAGLFRVGFPISIHALREEGDGVGKMSTTICRDFYPRPPRGGRHVSIGYQWVFIIISIHALREEGDSLPINSLIP